MLVQPLVTALLPLLLLRRFAFALLLLLLLALLFAGLAVAFLLLCLQVLALLLLLVFLLLLLLQPLVAALLPLSLLGLFAFALAAGFFLALLVLVALLPVVALLPGALLVARPLAFAPSLFALALFLGAAPVAIGARVGWVGRVHGVGRHSRRVGRVRLRVRRAGHIHPAPAATVDAAPVVHARRRAGGIRVVQGSAAAQQGAQPGRAAQGQQTANGGGKDHG